jgi:ABC-type nickel/cobalt efflux system permease component RcnA
VGYGLALVAAFSLGLAASLMAVGAVAVRGRSAVARMGSRPAAWIPLASAAAIVGFGAYLAALGLRGL